MRDDDIRDIRRQAIEDASLDDLIKGKFDSKSGSELSDPALDLAIAFSAMPTEQIIAACHHDYRLSDQIRQAALNLSLAIDTRLDSQADSDRDNAEYYEADRRLDEMKAAV